MNTVQSKTIQFALIILCFAFFPARSLAQPRDNQNPSSSVSLAVKDLDVAYAQLQAKVNSHGGKIVQQSKNSGNGMESASVKAEFASLKVGSFLHDVRELGRVTNENTTMPPDAQPNDNQFVAVNLTVENSPGNRNYSSPQNAVFAGVIGAGMNVGGLGFKNHSMTGGGITISASHHWAQFNLLVFKNPDPETIYRDPPSADEKKPDESSSLATISHNVYSSILGGGNNEFLNPFAGIIYGYGHIENKSTFAIGGDIGLELIKLRYGMWCISGSMLGLYNALEGGNASLYSTSLTIPF